MTETYKSLYQIVTNILTKEGIISQTTSIPTQIKSLQQALVNNSNTTKEISNNLSAVLPSQAVSGLDISIYTDILSVKVTKGSAYFNSKILTLSSDTILSIPQFDMVPSLGVSQGLEPNIEGLWYINLESSDILSISKYGVGYVIGSIYIPSNFTASLVMDYNEDTSTLPTDSNIGIVSYVGEKAEQQKIKNESIDASRIVGDFVLGEGCIMTNKKKTFQIGDRSVDFMDSTGKKLASYSDTQALIGNIKITPDTIEDSNFVAGSQGFQIRANGEAEFANVIVRGTVFANSGSFSGDISANTGHIGGWAILSDRLSGTGAYHPVLMGSGAIYFGNNFQIENTGYITAQAGNIGGWEILSDRLSGDNAYLMSSGALYLGSNFRVETDGDLIASKGSIGGWDIAANRISAGNLWLNSDGSIQSANYSAGSVGFKIDDTRAEFQNASIRGELHTSIFVKDEYHATNGYMIVSNASTLSSGVGTGDSSLVVRENVFASGEVLVARWNDGTNTQQEYMFCNAAGSVTSDGYSFAVIRNHDGLGAKNWQSGIGIVSTGQSGTGYLILDATSPSESPTIRVHYRSGSNWNDTIEKVVLGKLDGLLMDGMSPSGFGIATNNGYFSGAVYASSFSVATGAKITADQINFNYAGSSTPAGDALNALNVSGTDGGVIRANAASGATFTDADAGALAYSGSVDLATGEVINKTAANITYTVGGVTVDSLKPDEAGANITENRMSSGTGSVGGKTSTAVATATTNVEAGKPNWDNSYTILGTNSGTWATVVDRLLSGTGVVTNVDMSIASLDTNGITIYNSGSTNALLMNSEGLIFKNIAQDQIKIFFNTNDADAYFSGNIYASNGYFSGDLYGEILHGSSISGSYISGGTMEAPVIQTAKTGARITINDTTTSVGGANSWLCFINPNYVAGTLVGKISTDVTDVGGGALMQMGNGQCDLPSAWFRSSGDTSKLGKAITSTVNITNRSATSGNGQIALEVISQDWGVPLKLICSGGAHIYMPPASLNPLLLSGITDTNGIFAYSGDRFMLNRGSTYGWSDFAQVKYGATTAISHNIGNMLFRSTAGDRLGIYDNSSTLEYFTMTESANGSPNWLPAQGGNIFIDNGAAGNQIYVHANNYWSALLHSGEHVGATWHDGNQACLKTYNDYNTKSLMGCMFTQTSSPGVSGSTTETSLIGTGVGTNILGANEFRAGKTIRLKAHGLHSVVGNETVRWRLFLDTTCIGDTTAVSDANGTDEEWHMDAIITCRSTGAAGIVQACGNLLMHEAGTTVTGLSFNSGATIGTLTTRAIGLKFTHGNNNAGNKCTCTNLTIECLN